MRIDAELRYSRPPAEVATMTTQREFQDLKCRATGALSYDIDITERGDRTVITTRRTMPTDDLPEFALAFLRNGLIVEEIDDWGPAGADGSRDGTITVTILDTPLTMTGTLALRPAADGSVVTLGAELVAKIPLVGPRIEKAAAPAVLAAVRAEEKAAQRWVADER